MHSIKVKCYFFTLFVFIICIKNAYSNPQQPYLERLVTLNVKEQRVAEIFKSITEQTTVVFSYTSFNDQQKITKNYDHLPLSTVLNDLMKDLSFSYTLKGKYIIIRCEKNQLKTDQGGMERNTSSHKDTIALLKNRCAFLPEKTIVSFPLSASVLRNTAKKEEPIISPPKEDDLLFQIGLQLTLAKPVDGKSDASNLGLAFNANYFVKPRIAIELNVSQNSFSLGNIPAYNNFHCSVTQLGLGGEYFLVNKTFKFFISMNAGLYVNKVKYSYSHWVLPYLNAFYVSYVTTEESDTEYRFGYAPGIGFSYRLNRRMHINSGIKYHVILSKYGVIPYWYRNIGLLVSF